MTIAINTCMNSRITEPEAAVLDWYAHSNGLASLRGFTISHLNV